MIPITELKNATILVVDDHAENLDILIAYLDKFGFTIMVAQNGEEAIELALEFVPDIILLDVMMPGMDGFETCRRLKNHHTTESIPIIFMTALSETIDKVTGFEAGGVDYITKPLQHDEVLVRVKTHLTISQQQKKLEQLNATKNRFLGTAAHDLRNPLSAVRGFAEILVEGAAGTITPEQEEFLEMIYELSDHMLSLVNDLLDVAVIESGQFDMELEPGSLKKVLSKRIKLMQPIASKKQIQLNLDLKDVPDIEFDKNRILQVFDNLFSNAVKFSPFGSTISIRLFTEGARVRVDMQDEGAGIAAEDVPRLFGEFQKVSTEPTGGEKGTGLGLSIVKKIVEAHHGSVLVDSEPGQGTTVSFTLPLVR